MVCESSQSGQTAASFQSFEVLVKQLNFSIDVAGFLRVTKRSAARALFYSTAHTTLYLIFMPQDQRYAAAATTTPQHSLCSLLGATNTTRNSLKTCNGSKIFQFVFSGRFTSGGHCFRCEFDQNRNFKKPLEV